MRNFHSNCPLQWNIKGNLCENKCATILWAKNKELNHCVKSVLIQSFFWSVFSRLRTEYGQILRISLNSVRMRENTDQKKNPYLDTFHAVNILITSDPLSCKQSFRRANYWSYYWLHCTNKVFTQLSLTSNLWNKKNNWTWWFQLCFMDYNFLLQLSGKRINQKKYTIWGLWSRPWKNWKDFTASSQKA